MKSDVCSDIDLWHGYLPAMSGFQQGALIPDLCSRLPTFEKQWAAREAEAVTVKQWERASLAMLQQNMSPSEVSCNVGPE